jgi:hypothetical protein
MNSTFSLSRLHSISRTYGGNTLKVEPRELDNLPVINPMVLPEATREKLRGCIDDFYHHQQASRLQQQIDEVVEVVLAAAPAASQLSTPTQLSLLEPKRTHR